MTTRVDGTAVGSGRGANGTNGTNGTNGAPGTSGLWLPKGLNSTDWFYPVTWITDATLFTTFTAGQAKYLPFTVGEAMSIDAVCYFVQVSDAAASWVLAIYNDNGHMRPGSLIGTSGSLSDASTGNKKKTFAAIALPAAGLYWYTFVPQGTQGTAQLVGLNGGTRLITQYFVPITDANLTAANTNTWGHLQTGVTGAIPDPAAPTAIAGGNIPLVPFRKA